MAIVTQFVTQSSYVRRRPRRYRPPGDVILAEQDDDWTVSGPLYRTGILAACRKAARPGAGQNDTSEAGMAEEVIFLLTVSANRSKRWLFIIF